MEKRKYEKPMLISEAFIPNEYVAVCWGVGCSVGEANAIEERLGNYNYPHLYHGADHCGLSSNQVIYDDDGDGTADRMVEIGTDGLGKLTCTIYTDSGYSTTKAVGSVELGETIYWTTTAGSKTWHHVGTVAYTPSNMS